MVAKKLAKDLQASGGDTRPTRVIRSEEDAIKLLVELEKITGPAPFRIAFDGWPIFSAKLKGKKFDSTITTGVMQGFLALQTELNRGYTVVKFGTERTPHLSRPERETLELQVKVKKGSSDFLTINTPKIFDAIAQSLNSMESAHTAMVLIFSALAYFGSSAVKAWLNGRKEIRLKEIDADQDSSARSLTIEMSKQETARTSIMSQMIKEQPDLRSISASANSAHEDFLKSTRSADSIEIQGVEMPGDFVREVTSSERRSFQVRTLRKKCRILKVDSSTEAKYAVTIRILDTKQELTCPLEDETMDARYKDKILDALKTRASLMLNIEARVHGGLLREVKILGVQN